MEQDTQTQDPALQTAGGDSQVSETPSIEQLQAQLQEKEAKLREMGVEKSTLERIVQERNSFSPQTQPAQNYQRQEVDLDREAEAIFKRAIDDQDHKGAAKELKNLLSNAEKSVVDRVSREFKTVLDVKDGLNEMYTRKPHFKGFQQEIQGQIAQYINQGYDWKRAMREVEGMYESKLAGFVPQKPQQQSPAQAPKAPPPANSQVSGNTQGIAAHMPPKQEKKSEPETYDQYLNRRSERMFARVNGIRK